jgi:hypothetical protein
MKLISIEIVLLPYKIYGSVAGSLTTVYERMVVAYFNVLSWNYFGRIEEYYRKHSVPVSQAKF